jgi:transcriptional regulator with XRE-family HTH domain
MSIGSRIKECREKLGITQEELAKKMGVSKGAIGNYESGIGYPKVENMTKLFSILQTDANYLFQDEVSNTTNERVSLQEQKHIKKYRTLDEYGKEVVESVLDIEAKRCEAAKRQPVFTFRRLSEHKVSAGCGFDLNDPDQWKEIDVLDTAEARQADFAVEVEGASMEPDYYDGDIVYISLASEVPVGKVGLFIQNGKGFIKEAGKDRIISRNPEYDDIFPSDGDIECKGLVIGLAELPD